MRGTHLKGAPLVIPKKEKKIQKKIFFFSNITTIFATRKILKMENSLSGNKKNLIFEIL